MKQLLLILFLGFSVMGFSQKKPVISKKPAKKTFTKTQKNSSVKPNVDLEKINDSIPALIPQKVDGKVGYINQRGKFIIKPEYRIAVFFAEDCNLQNSPKESLRKYGSKDYATVVKDTVSYRIDQTGKKVYLFKDQDLGKCKFEFKRQLFHAFQLGQYYGLIEDSKFINPADYSQYRIYPQYDYLHVLEGDDLKNPMIVATKDNKFGVIDINNRVIIPFDYMDIKKNFSWKLGRMFEVSKDGKNYYFVDDKNKAY